MEPERKEIVNNFLGRTSYTIPVPVAAEVTGASMQEIANWRQRDILPAPPIKLAGRYFVTRDGLIGIGLMRSLSDIGLLNASAIGNCIMGVKFAQHPHGLDLETLSDSAVFFWKAGQGEENTLRAGDYVLDFDSIFPTDRLIHKLPLGQLVMNWAWKTEKLFTA